jgi:hypothetical protein
MGIIEESVRGKDMSNPRSSLAVALQDYKGIRPGIALTIAALALAAALVVGIAHIVMLGKSGAALAEGQMTVRMLNNYQGALELWRRLASLPDSEIQLEQQRRVRDSIGVALRVNLQDLRRELANPVDQQLVSSILENLRRPGSGPDGATEDLAQRGRGAMIVLTARQDSALFRAFAGNQRAQLFAAIVIALTLVAAVLLIAPISWVYVRYKRGVPPGM